jgi:hypothetical protein
MKFTKKQEFIKLQDEWDKKLAQEGFKDIEDRKGNLKRHDIRTQAYQNQIRIREFFLLLDHLLTNYPDIPPFERKVLELYSQGQRLNLIVQEVHASDRHVRNVITRYKGLIAAIKRMQD